MPAIHYPLSSLKSLFLNIMWIIIKRDLVVQRRSISFHQSFRTRAKSYLIVPEMKIINCPLPRNLQNVELKDNGFFREFIKFIFLKTRKSFFREISRNVSFRKKCFLSSARNPKTLSAQVIYQINFKINKSTWLGLWFDFAVLQLSATLLPLPPPPLWLW